MNSLESGEATVCNSISLIHPPGRMCCRCTTPQQEEEFYGNLSRPVSRGPDFDVSFELPSNCSQPELSGMARAKAAMAAEKSTPAPKLAWHWADMPRAPPITYGQLAASLS